MDRGEFLKLSGLGIGALSIGALFSSEDLPKETTLKHGIHKFDTVMFKNEVVAYIQNIFPAYTKGYTKLTLRPLGVDDVFGKISKEDPILYFSNNHPVDFDKPMYDVIYSKYNVEQMIPGEDIIITIKQ